MQERIERRVEERIAQVKQKQKARLLSEQPAEEPAETEVGMLTIGDFFGEMALLVEEVLLAVLVVMVVCNLPLKCSYLRMIGR